jgi:hypothetical protein
MDWWIIIVELWPLKTRHELRLLLFEKYTCSNFQPSDMVETICVSSSS